MREEYEEPLRPSRSAKKREAKGVEELVMRLLDLAEAELKKLPASEEVAGELRLARSVQNLGARKRQAKHLAGVLRKREEETEQIRAFLDGYDQVHLDEIRDFHRLEQLRDQLCDRECFEPTLNKIRSEFPLLDAQGLSRLARSVHEHGDKRAFREIFKRLRQALEAD